MTFSAAQEDAILTELEHQATRHPELGALISDDRLRGFFVKNLENVQGDEHDIIIFSVGYGPDEVGRFTVQMGPLNKDGGWRRLNVATPETQDGSSLASNATARCTTPRRSHAIVTACVSSNRGTRLAHPSDLGHLLVP